MGIFRQLTERVVLVRWDRLLSRVVPLGSDMAEDNHDFEHALLLLKERSLSPDEVIALVKLGSELEGKALGPEREASRPTRHQLLATSPHRFKCPATDD